MRTFIVRDESSVLRNLSMCKYIQLIFIASNNKKYRTHMDCLRGLYFTLYTQLISKLIVKSNQNIYHGFKQ
jgi:hypothetical protein